MSRTLAVKLIALIGTHAGEFTMTDDIQAGVKAARLVLTGQRQYTARTEMELFRAWTNVNGQVSQNPDGAR